MAAEDKSRVLLRLDILLARDILEVAADCNEAAALLEEDMNIRCIISLYDMSGSVLIGGGSVQVLISVRGRYQIGYLYDNLNTRAAYLAEENNMGCIV